MAVASDNVFPKIITGMQVSDPAAPVDSSWKLYAKANGIFARSSNAVVGPFGTGGGGMTNPMTTTGDMIYSSSGSTPARLAIAAAGYALMGGTVPAWAYPPGHEFDYAQITSGVSITATTEATATTIVTGNSVTYDGSTTVMIEFYAPYATADHVSIGDILVPVLYDGSSSIGQLGILSDVTNTSNMYLPLRLAYRLTPSNAAHTYSIRAYTSNTPNGFIGAGAGGSGAYMPAFIRITKA